MKNKHESKIKYEANGKPYLVMSEKSNFGKKIKYYYGLHDVKQLDNIPTNELENGDIAVVKNDDNGKYYKFIWVSDIDWQYENWVSCGELDWKSKKIESETENMIEENKEKLIPFHEMTCEQMKKQYPNLNMLYEHCWVEKLNMILDYCDVNIRAESETWRKAKIVVKFKSNLMNRNESVTILANIWGKYDKEVGKKVYYTDIFVEEIHGNCTLTMLRLIDATCDTLKKMLENLNLDNTYGGDYARIYHIFDSFKLYQNSECSDDNSCDCDEEGM